jgi:hypothetical protein
MEDSSVVKIFGYGVNAIAGLVAVAAGIYLLSRQNASGDTWLEVIAHGVGVYFIARGLHMIGSSIASAAANER